MDKSEITIVEVGPRDGLQNESTNIPTQLKPSKACKNTANAPCNAWKTWAYYQTSLLPYI